MAQAWGQNAVIVKDDGNFSVRWKPRCPYCGYVPMNRENGGTAQKGMRASHSAQCDKCGKSFEVVITRS